MTALYPRGHWRDRGPRQKLIHDKCGQVIADWPTSETEKDHVFLDMIMKSHSERCETKGK